MVREHYKQRFDQQRNNQGEKGVIDGLTGAESNSSKSQSNSDAESEDEAESNGTRRKGVLDKATLKERQGKLLQHFDHLMKSRKIAYQDLYQHNKMLSFLIGDFQETIDIDHKDSTLQNQQNPYDGIPKISKLKDSTS